MPQIPPVDQLKEIATGGDYTLSGVLLVFACFVCYMIFRIIGWSGTKVSEVASWVSVRVDEGLKIFFEHLNTVNETMTSMKDSSKALEQSLTGINSRLDTMEGKIDHLSEHVDHLDQQIKKS